MSYIIFSGCSFTAESYYWQQFIKTPEENLLHDYHRGLNLFPAWPEILTNKLNKKTSNNHECVNVAVSGDSNQQAIRNIFTHLETHEKPEAIVIGLTEWTRFIDYYGNSITCSLVSDLGQRGFYDDPESFDELEEIIIDYQKARYNVHKLKSATASTIFGFMEGKQEGRYYHGAIKLNLEYLEYLILYCRHNGIKLLICQLLSPWWPGSVNQDDYDYQYKHVNYECNKLKNRINRLNSYFDRNCVFLSDDVCGLEETIRENQHILSLNWKHCHPFHCSNVPVPSTGKSDPGDQHPNKEGHEYIASLLSKDFNALLNH